MYPSICRISTSKNIKQEITDRFEILQLAEKMLITEFKRYEYIGSLKMSKFREVCWAILQHYQVCHTPLLDITQSIRVAISFALNSSTDYSYIYILGFPYINGSISYCVEEELLNVKLLSICPPKAIRPHFQEGYLVGSFPSVVMRKTVQLYVSRRLIAKFKIIRNNFILDKSFLPIPNETLFPKSDHIMDICNNIKYKLKQVY